MKYRLIALWILVVGIPADSSFPAQPIAQAVEAALVRVGRSAPGKVPPTFGSGFVIEYLGRVYVVTCSTFSRRQLPRTCWRSRDCSTPSHRRARTVS